MARRTNLLRTTPEQDAEVEAQARRFVEAMAATAPGQAMMFALVRELVRLHGAETVGGFVSDAEREIERESAGGEEEFDEHDRMVAGKLLRVCERVAATRPRPIGHGDERYER